MRASHYEVHTVCKRAFAGLGFANGVDDDAAAMVAWAELNGLQGLERLASVLDSLDSNQSGKIDVIAREGSTAELDGDGQSVLAVGAAAVELAGVLAGDSGSAEVTLRDCRDQPFAISLAAKLAAQGHFVELRWRDGEQLTRCCSCGGEVKLCSAPANDAIDADTLSIRISPADSSIPCQADWSLDADAEHCALARGIEPPEALWQSLLGYGHRRLVPATEASRELGAGGGDAND